MKKATGKFFIGYNIIFCLFLLVGAIITGSKTQNFVSASIFAPILISFLMTIFFPEKRIKPLIVYGFVITTIMNIMGAIGSRTVAHMVSTVLFLPLTAYFWAQMIPQRKNALPVIEIIEPTKAQNVVKPVKTKNLYDINRRQFLKIIGSAGITLFMMSIFTKRAEAAFFGSAPGQGTVALKDSTGAVIDPAIKQPTDGYKISEIDDSSPAYYGFVEKTGKWFITKEDSNGAYRYTKGDSNFSASWANRASLTYDYFNDVF